jgi:hypothetical protein
VRPGRLRARRPERSGAHARGRADIGGVKIGAISTGGFLVHRLLSAPDMTETLVPIRTLSLALVAGLMLATASSAEAAGPRPIAARVDSGGASPPASSTASSSASSSTSSTAPAPAPRPEAASYADREKRSDKVADFEGGSVVVIALSGSGIVILLLLLLLLG